MYSWTQLICITQLYLSIVVEKQIKYNILTYASM